MLAIDQIISDERIKFRNDFLPLLNSILDIGKNYMEYSSSVLSMMKYLDVSKNNKNKDLIRKEMLNGTRMALSSIKNVDNSVTITINIGSENNQHVISISTLYIESEYKNLLNAIRKMISNSNIESWDFSGVEISIRDITEEIKNIAEDVLTVFTHSESEELLSKEVLNQNAKDIIISSPSDVFDQIRYSGKILDSLMHAFLQIEYELLRDVNFPNIYDIPFDDQMILMSGDRYCKMLESGDFDDIHEEDDIPDIQVIHVDPDNPEASALLNSLGLFNKPHHTMN